MVLPHGDKGNTRHWHGKMRRIPLVCRFLPPTLATPTNQTETPNMLKKTLLAALFAVPALSAWAETYLIDVRTPAEYAEAHADGAINIPVEDVAAKISEVTADKDADIYVYCRSGRRAYEVRAGGFFD